jgi:hypothetical protein
MEKGGNTAAENSQDAQEKSLETKIETKTETEAERNNDEKIYPPMRKVLPAMLAIYLVFFLVALV